MSAVGINSVLGALDRLQSKTAPGARLTSILSGYLLTVHYVFCIKNVGYTKKLSSENEKCPLSKILNQEILSSQLSYRLRCLAPSANGLSLLSFFPFSHHRDDDPRDFPRRHLQCLCRVCLISLLSMIHCECEVIKNPRKDPPPGEQGAAQKYGFKVG